MNSKRDEWSDPTKIRMLRAGVFALIRMLKERGVESHPVLTDIDRVLKQTEIKQP